MTRDLLTERDLGDAAYADARHFLRDDELVELVTLVGYYSTLALLMRVFRVDAPHQQGQSPDRTCDVER